jgi:hypothetical protein
MTSPTGFATARSVLVLIPSLGEISTSFGFAEALNDPVCTNDDRTTY